MFLILTVIVVIILTVPLSVPHRIKSKLFLLIITIIQHFLIFLTIILPNLHHLIRRQNITNFLLHLPRQSIPRFVLFTHSLSCLSH